MKFKMGAAEIKAARKQPGGSNVGKKTFASGKPRTGPYAGSSGGAPKGSYPIPDKAHAKAAIKMSGHAPNPAGIKSAVYRKYPNLKPEDKKQDGSKGVKSFPDLNKDGKVSKADVLVGRGVIPAKKMQMGSKELKTMRKDLPKSMTPTSDNLKNKVKGVVKGVKDFVKEPKKTLNKLNPFDNAVDTTSKKMCGSKSMKYAEGTKSIKFKKKPMMKRADGSTSQRGLYDNIRANKGSGKKPTPEMLKQEKKIKFGK